MMGPAFERWIDKFTSFQTRRASGVVPTPWEDLTQLASHVDELACEGLDFRSVAECLCKIERATLLYEEREYDECLSVIDACTPTIVPAEPFASMIAANKECLYGNVYLVRDEDFEQASIHFQRALDTSGPLTPLISGNAAINLGICQTNMQKVDEAIESYKLAATFYELAGRNDKMGVCLHTIGNSYRQKDQTERGISFLFKAIHAHQEISNTMGVWAVADDISRGFLSLSLDHPNKQNEHIENARRMSDIAFAAGCEIWKTLKGQEKRLAELSDQMLNLAVTRCELAMLEESPEEMLASLAVMKGRIRLVSDSVPYEVLRKHDDEFKEALNQGVPFPHLTLVIEALEQLAQGKTIALIEQFAINGDELAMAYIVPARKRTGGICTALESTITNFTPSGLRGRQRGGKIANVCNDLIQMIHSHSHRCSMVLPEDITTVSSNEQIQLRKWNDEFDLTLRKLGSVFFPDQIIDDLRSMNVQHVILSIDPLFTRLPYQTLIGKYGAIVDEPWSLSLVTSSMELVRVANRRQRQCKPTQSIQWFAPDLEVNERRGGNSEARALAEILPTIEIREEAATIERFVEALHSGKLCHFRGHGRWSGDVRSSGPVFANDQILSSDRYGGVDTVPGFLFTAACLTGFGEPVGTELLGSLVDYDRAGLFGAVLTNWPIHGEAASVFTAAFYRELVSSKNSAVALQRACVICREQMPHSYLWSAFTCLGGWDLSGVLPNASV